MNKKYSSTFGWFGSFDAWSKDLISGFIVALLALPLSLGIASASDFPNPLYGVLTAIIGGVVVSFISGAPLTIKGPAAGLIVIVAGSVSALGWETTLSAIVVAAICQILFGLLKLGKLSNFFPLSAVHGMLAAIGIIIISKQLHILMGINPTFPAGAMIHGELVAGKPLVAPLDLFMALPNTFVEFMRNQVFQMSFLVGAISLIVVFAWPLIKHPTLKKIPAPLVVLVISIPVGMFSGLTQDNKQLVKVGDFWSIINFHADFSHISDHIGTFVQYVVLFAIIGSLESLLTGRAIDLLDPYKRKSNFNRDLIAIGVGNAIAGTLGGLPMISEVARSSSNVNNGGKTRWANFFHGVVLFIFVAFLSSIIQLIPKSALAALLIGVGFKLAHPKEFIHMFRIGKEQLIVFIATIIFTLVEDLLVGIAAGILVEMIVLLAKGAKLNSLFKSQADISFNDERYEVRVNRSVLFTNFMGLKRGLESIPPSSHVQIYFDQCGVIDHSAMDQLEQFRKSYELDGGIVEFLGLNNHRSFSKHELAGRKL